ncbi:uncharacterized protein LOC122007386 [Zingiber officinale]|uniref:uncharacterized protein LOC122007386 n=1 Tax=Zingiber officinale TaxID=94328 RepID=UPI001C4C07F3|nr:uncharacterized protein LOC122007386 [Zingiber officinale]
MALGCEFLLLEMDTIVSAARDRHRYICSSKSGITSQFGSFSPSSSFRGMNCRAFNSDVAFMQSLPNKYFTIDGFSEAKSPSYSPQTSKKSKRSTPIPINRKPAPKEAAFTTDIFHSELCAGPAYTKYAPKGSPCTTDLSRSELWAGPAYTNSPPPSSLPIPKFSLRVRRSVSLELPLSKSDFVLQPLSKSAPLSPARESASSASGFFCHNDIATETLRRILHLDIIDD